MYSGLLAIIYIAFISLGLPDSLLGAAWPVMRTDLGVPISYAGIISMIIAAGTVVSSLLSNRLTRWLGTGLLTATSVLLTGLALFGFSVSGSYLLLCLFAVPYGLGAGAVDAAINNYVALHYSARHLNWLHCAWGVGAGASPYIMSYCLMGGLGWHWGYGSVATIQMILTVLLFTTLPLWKQKTASQGKYCRSTEHKNLFQIVRIPGVRLILLAFFCYCAVESTAGLWASSYLVMQKGIAIEAAAMFASLFYIGITVGRFISGFVANQLGDKKLIRAGSVLMVAGIMIVWFPTSLAPYGLIIIGLGCAPMYPSIIHSTPSHFGEENSQGVIGIQMASAYVGITFMPPLFGLIAERVNISTYPFYLLVFTLIFFLLMELLFLMHDS